MNQPPAISVILPVYNAEAYVREAVESVLAQTFTDFECIIINDGSTDGSGAILRELAARDTRIVLVECPNDGLVSALNRGLEMARAELIARMDADDVSMPERFALQHARMVQEPELAVLGSFMRNMDKEGNISHLVESPITPKKTLHCMERGCSVHHATVMMWREAVLKAGGYRKAFSHAEDYDLWLRMSNLGYAIASLPQPLYNRRWHGTNVSSVYRGLQGRNTILARLAHRLRKAGLPDPFEGVETIDDELIQAIPTHLRQCVDTEFFVDRYYRLSFADSREELDAAWREYLQLDTPIQDTPWICYFLMRLLKGALRQRYYHMVLLAFVEAFCRHPKVICGFLWKNRQYLKLG